MESNEMIACLNPPEEWQPAAEPAFIRFRSRMMQPSVRKTAFRKWPVLAMAVVIIMAVLWPQGRGIAQQLWQFLTVRKLAFVRVNAWPEGVPGPDIKFSGIPIPPWHVSDVDEARSRVHYDPRLPRPGVLSGGPSLSTTPGLSVSTLIHSADLQLALRRTGIDDATVPAQWEGARLGLHTSDVVIAEWPNVTLAQSLPLTFTAPPDFDVAAFSALILRISGVGPEDAARMAQSAGTVPPWLVPISRDLVASATMEQIALNSGAATLVQEEKAWGREGRISIVWSVPDRVYLLTGYLDRGLAIAAANAVQ